MSFINGVCVYGVFLSTAFWGVPREGMTIPGLGMAMFLPLFWVMYQPIRSGCRFWVVWGAFQCLFGVLFWMNPFLYYERYRTLSMVGMMAAFYLVLPFLFAWMFGWFERFSLRLGGWRLALVFGAAWGGFEYLLTVLPGMMPLSYAVVLTEVPFLLQPAQWIGAIGLSVLMMVVQVLVMEIGFYRRMFDGVILLSIFVVWVGLGLLFVREPFFLDPEPASSFVSPESVVLLPESKTLELTLVQPNFSWRESYYAVQGNFLFRRICRKLRYFADLAAGLSTGDLSSGPIASGLLTSGPLFSGHDDLFQFDTGASPDLGMADITHVVSNRLLVFPELTISDFDTSDPEMAPLFLALSADRSYVLIGVRDSDRNTILMLGPSGNRLGAYHKQTLVPFFESDELAGAETQSPLVMGGYVSSPSDLSGDPDMLLDLTGPKIGVCLCYEVLFPSILRELVSQGADVIGVLSYNSWLGQNRWSILHAATLSLRAVELRRYGFFVNNHGPSSIVDPLGRRLDLLPMGQAGLLTMTLPFSQHTTFFARFGHVGLGVLILLSGAIYVRHQRRWRFRSSLSPLFVEKEVI